MRSKKTLSKKRIVEKRSTGHSNHEVVCILNKGGFSGMVWLEPTVQWVEE